MKNPLLIAWNGGLRPILIAYLATLALGCASGSGPSEHGSDWPEANRGRTGAKSSAAEALSLGRGLLEEGRDGAAMARYLRAYIESDRGPEAREAIAWLQLRHDVAVAERIFEDFTREDPSRRTAWYGLGLARALRGDPNAAIAALERSLALAPEDVPTRIALSSAEVARGDLDAALRHAEQAYASDGHDADAANALGYARLLRDDLAGAEPMLQRARSLDPTRATFRNNLATCLAMQGRYVEALDLFAEDGALQEAYNNLGVILMAQDDPGAAASALERALLVGGEMDRTVLENLRRASNSRR